MSRIARRVATVLAALGAACAAHAQMPEAATAPLSIRVPKEERIAFKGLPHSAAVAGSPGTMMYPAPNLGGLIVGILTHAAIETNMQSAGKAKQQSAADEVVKPLQPVLDGYPARELYLRAVDQPIGARKATLAEGDATPSSSSPTVAVLPVYLVPSDVRALVLEVAVTLVAPTAPDPSPPSAPRSIVVVSDPWYEPDDVEPVLWWTEDDGAHLRTVTALMLRHALDVAMTFGERDGGDGPQKTVRYLQGQTERMERARVLRASCGRAVIRTLRGAIMSVPLPEPVETGCADRVVLR